MNLVVPFGFYGSGNIGDEATLMGFARLLSLSDRPTRVGVATRNPAHCARVEPAFSYFRSAGRDPRRWWAKMRASAFVFAGGTPIMDILGDWPLSEVVPQIRAAARRGCAVGFMGIGVESLARPRSQQIVAEEIAPHARHWSVRCERDRQRLSEYGVATDSITVAADMAWLIEPVGDGFGRGRLQQWGLGCGESIVGVNLVNENSLFRRHPEIVDEIAGALDELVVSRQAKVVLLSNEVRGDDSYDAAAAKMVLEKMRHPSSAIIAPSEYFSPGEMMSIVSCCDLIVTMRYHACIFAALQGVPFVALTRSDKISDLCWDLDWPAALGPAEFRANQMPALAESAVNAVKCLPRRIAELRRRAQRNLTCLYALGGSEPAQQSSLAVH